MTCKRIWSNCQHLFELKAWGLVPGHLRGHFLQPKATTTTTTTTNNQWFYSFTSNFPKHMKFSCKWTESKSVTEVRFAVLAIANGWDGWLSKWSIIKCESLKVSFVWFFISLNWCFLGGRRIEPQDICLQWCMGEPSCKKSLSSLEYQNCNIVLARFFLHHRTCWWRWSCIHWCFFPCNCCFSQDCG